MRIEHLWLALPVAVVVWKGLSHRLSDIDFWWHLKAGEVILTTGSIPRTDLFSFTAAGRPYVHQAWLMEVLYCAVHRAGDLPLLIALNTALLVAALLPVYRLCSEAAGTPRVAACAAYLPALSLTFYGLVRPQVASFTLFALFYWILSSPQRRGSKLLWLLPALMGLWVNLHGAFVLGLGLLTLFLLCEAARRLLGAPESPSSPELRRLATALFAALVATLANPEGPGVYAPVRAVLTDPSSQTFVAEWQPPRVDRLEGIQVFYGPFLIVLLALLASTRRPRAWESGFFLAFAVFAMTATRNGIWFSLVAAPILARHLAAIDWRPLEPLRRFRLIDGLVGSVSRPADPNPRHGLNAAIAGVALAATVVASPWVYPRLGVKRLGTTVWSPKTPVGAMDYLQAHRVEGNIFHPQAYGDYLMWRLWPRQRTFIDGRVHLFDPSVVRDYLLAFLDPHWEQRLAKYDIRYILLSKSEEEQKTLIASARASAGWRLRYEDEESVLFEKKAEEPPASPAR